MSHSNCHTDKGHVCQKRTRPKRICIERDCSETAGTLWGPMWCPEHDEERLDKITKSLEEIQTSLGASND